MRSKIGLVGCGTWGNNILTDLLGLGQEVVVVESNQQRCRQLVAEFPITTVADLSQISGISGVVVATPASTHADVLRHLLPLQVPIFVEKPLTDHPETARELAREGGHLIFAMHIWHYHGGVRMLADIARNSDLGAVNLLRTVRTNWTSPRKDVDSVWTLVPHDLSIAKAILGEIPTPVFAQAERLGGRAVGMLAVLGAAKPRVIIDTSNRYRDKRREIRLHCEEGTAVLPKDDAGHIEIDREERSSSSRRSGEIRRFKFEPPLRTELEVFLKYLAGGPPPPTDIEHGVEVVEKIAALRRLANLPMKMG